MDNGVSSTILPKFRWTTWTHYLNLANSSFFFFFFLRNMVNVLEVLFKNSFLEVTLGFFLSPVGEISPKKKRFYIIWPFLRVQQNFNHMGFSDAIHGWMMGRMDGWKASRKTTTTSFTICNYMKHTTSLITWLLVLNNLSTIIVWPWVIYVCSMIDFHVINEVMDFIFSSNAYFYIEYYVLLIISFHIYLIFLLNIVIRWKHIRFP